MSILRIGNINGWPALSYGRAWVASTAGGRWTCLDPTCGAHLDIPILKGRTDEQRDEDRERLHAFARRHAHMGDRMHESDEILWVEP